MKFVFAAAALLAGCAHTLVTPDALAGKNVAVIQSDRSVRVIAAVEQALLTGKPQKLAPYRRSRRPVEAQSENLSAAKVPQLVDAHQPSEGR